MFLKIAWFEVLFHLRSWMVWIFLSIVTLLIFGAVGTDQVQVGGALSNTYRNAPFVIENFYSFIGLLTLLMSTAFVNSAAIRDFKYNTYQLLFSTPLRRIDFLLGRFIGATLISMIPMLGVSLGILVAKYMPWVDPERWGRVDWLAHLRGIYVFALPNTLFVAAVLFAIAVLARKEIVSFVGAIVLLVGYGVAGALTQDIQHEQLAGLLDPFGRRAFGSMIKYWTVAEKNSLSVGWEGPLLWNRLLWIGAGGVIFLVAYARFSFAERRSKAKTGEPETKWTMVPAALPGMRAQLHDAPWAKFAGSLRIHFLGMARSTVFIVVALLALANCVPSLIISATEGYGDSTLPVTYWVLDLIRGTLYLFTLIVIIFFAGALVWKDRDERMDEIIDATPAPEWISYASRLVTLIGMVMLIQLAALISGVAVQVWHGYHTFQLGLYLHELLVRDGSLFVFLSVLAFFIHVLAPNKYVGYFVYVAFLAANTFIWRPLNVATNLVQFAGTPNVTYSDFFRDLPYRTAWNWYTLYWFLFCGLLAVLSVMFWPRGRQDRWRARRSNAGHRFHRGWQIASLACAFVFAGTGGWIWYNTAVVNRLVGPKGLQRRQADYEKQYKPFEKLPQPRVRSVRYAIDIFPADRNISMRGDQVIYNPYPQPLTDVHFTVDPDYDVSIEIPGASPVKVDKTLFYRIYHFDSPLQPGEDRTMHFTVSSRTRGFENEVTNVQLVQDGTFFNNTIGPAIGYVDGRELNDPVERKKYQLKEKVLMPALERDCTERCRDTYLGGHSDWVNVETVISTSAEQTAIAPGSLVREWQKDGRRYFEYKLDHPSLNFYSFMSARYEVAREEWHGIKTEVYYIKGHPWNVPRMMNGIKKSLDYYITNFGPYEHKEARIIEFPRVARFAQAFPGTMPYSESIGFIANINHPDDIDMVFYVVGHEMGHQWWAHQVVGANMEGATLLSETMAQYSALMVMEKEYGRDIMRKFLQYEMDSYLRNRGQERVRERPLLRVEANQGYIHYRKGSVVLYYLKEMIGEEAVNRALRKVLH
ncbi:MAG TPA: M1 family aminopeptidase, partial [Candidatus Saccharimonadales bacterium]|nr:M1 family aminopeptidase [Candidatus Saccharimonadales bacterium]